MSDIVKRGRRLAKMVASNINHGPEAVMIRDLCDEVERLRAIVDRLPVDAEGNTIEIGNRPVVLYAQGGYMGTLHLDPECGWVVWPSCELGLQRPVHADESWPKGPEDCYSTREAAEVAAKSTT